MWKWNYIVLISRKNFISARNAGNMIPHAKHFDPKNPCPEPGVLELGQCYQLCEIFETI